MFSDSFVIKYKVKFCDCCRTFASLKYKGKFCHSYTTLVHLLEILRQILWLLHHRFICLNVLKLHSAIFDYKVKSLTKIVFYELWLAQRNFLAIWCDYSLNTIYCFKMWRESFIRITLILKFHKDCNFAGWFIHLFLLLIFLLSFLVNIALYQQGLIDSYQL